MSPEARADQIRKVRRLVAAVDKAAVDEATKPRGASKTTLKERDRQIRCALGWLGVHDATATEWEEW